MTSADRHDIVIRARLIERPDDDRMFYFAAAPPDYRASFSGSALPFASATQAFFDSPNRGWVPVDPQGNVVVRLRYPNAYYAGLGTLYVPPTLFAYYVVDGRRKHVSAPIGNGVPFRTLTYPTTQSSRRARHDCTFYSTEPKNHGVRSQEQILRDSAYPDLNATPLDFWGAKPPV